MRLALRWLLAVVVLAMSLALAGQPTFAGDPDIPQLTVRPHTESSAPRVCGDLQAVAEDGVVERNPVISSDPMPSIGVRARDLIARWIVVHAMLRAGR